MANLDLDTRLLSEFIYALNIARRQIAAYPPGHPIIATAAEKLLSLQEKLLEFRQEVTIGIARDTLLVDGKQLDQNNPVYRDFALNLFNANIASLTVQAGATVDDALLFFEIIANSRDQIGNGGGLAELLHSSGVHGFRAQEIDYRAFHATEVDSLNVSKISRANEESAVLWRAFARAMVSGTIDPNGVCELPQEQFDPVLLAEALNHEQVVVKGRETESYEHAIAEFINRSCGKQANFQSRQVVFDRLGLLIEQLSPELRRRFLNSTFQVLSATPDQVKDLLNKWSHATIIEALEQAETNQLQVPRIILDILGKLASQGSPEADQGQAAAGTMRNREQTSELFNKLFRDGAVESYSPKEYSDALAVMASANVATNLDPAQVEELLDNLNGYSLERQFCTIILELLEQGGGSQTVDVVTRNLEEMVPYFLDSGDFHTCAGVYEHLRLLSEKLQPTSDAAVNKVLDIFASEEFVGQVLDGLDKWGKDHYPEIREMIGRIGLPFVDPLLDRLAEEPVMALRRLYMECLHQIGAQALGRIVGRLNDPRWYVVRNLVVLMREINDPEVLRLLSRLFTHSHPKVQYEVIRTCLHFNDPRADRYLLHALEQTEAEFLTGIVLLATKSRNCEVAIKLANLLNSRGNSEPDLALKGAIINSLAEMDCVQAFPGLRTFIESRSLFTSKTLLRLKVEAVVSLARYSGKEASALLMHLHQNSSGEIAQAAEKVFLELRGQTS